MSKKISKKVGVPPDDKWVVAAQRAHRTATWAKTMTKVLISQSTGRQPKWQVLNFVGPKKAESTGIVDLIAIRKSHKQASEPLKRGDLFEIVLLQVKGGSAPCPTAQDRVRLRAVKKVYGAKEVLLSEWKQGARARLHRLVKDEWVELLDPAEVFCPDATVASRKKAEKLIAPSTQTPSDTPGVKSRTSADSARSAAAKKAWIKRKGKSD